MEANLTKRNGVVHSKDSTKDSTSHHIAELIDVDVVQVYGRCDGNSQRGLS